MRRHAGLDGRRHRRATAHWHQCTLESARYLLDGPWWSEAAHWAEIMLKGGAATGGQALAGPPCASTCGLHRVPQSGKVRSVS